MFEKCKIRGKKVKTFKTNQSNPAANEVSIAGAMSLAAVMMYFSVRDFLHTINRKRRERNYKNGNTNHNYKKNSVGLCFCTPSGTRV